MENDVIKLNEEQRAALKAFATRGEHNARLITRAKIILALDRSDKKEHLRIARICEKEGVCRSTVKNVRNDFLAAPSVEAFLQRKKRETPPVPPKVTGEVEARIIALACSEAPEGCARWTVRLLAEKSVELGIVESLSHMSVERLLKKRNSSLT